MECFHFTETTFHWLRFGDWKFLFMVEDEWFNGVQEEFVTRPITNLGHHPPERFNEARGFDEWQENRSWTMAPALGLGGRFLASFEDCPPRQAGFDADVDLPGLAGEKQRRLNVDEDPVGSDHRHPLELPTRMSRAPPLGEGEARSSRGGQ